MIYFILCVLSALMCVFTGVVAVVSLFTHQWLDALINGVIAIVFALVFKLAYTVWEWPIE